MVERILITGASGFVGSYLRPALATRWPDATITGLGAAIGGIIQDGLLPINVLNAEAVMVTVRDTKPDLIIHLAGQSSVAVGLAEDAHSTGDPTWMVNVSGSLNLAMAIARHVPSTTLLFASTAEVYGASFLGGSVSETSPTVPMNDYAKSKLLAEQIFSAVLPPSARLIVARPFNHTGPGQRDIFVLPSFAGQVARIEAGLQPARISVGNLQVRRDFLDVHDVVAAYLALVDAAPRLPMRFACNVASGTPRRLADLLEILRGLATVPFEVVVDPARLRPVDLPSASADPALLRAMTGWMPQISIEATLEALLTSRRNVPTG